MSATDWAALLDGIEARVRAQEAAIDGRSPYPPDDGFPPTVAGSLPAELRARALVLLARSRDLEARAGTELARRRGRLGQPTG